MRVGIIGIGDICKKAYLPLIAIKENLELILCTRNQDTLNEIKNKYKINEAVSSVDELINKKIDCAFVHTSTESHYEICKKLLSNGIHVHVDKPISYNLAEAVELANLAKNNKVILKVGFNRRVAPMIKDLKNLGKPDLILIQKNRVYLPGDPRVFVFDDFIHVVDTLRFLMGEDYTDLSVNYLKDRIGLKNIVIKLSNNKTTAIGIMNRDNGATEETIEYMSSNKKAIVTGLAHTKYLINNETSTKSFGDWDNTLYKRGFTEIIDSFIADVSNKSYDFSILDDYIKTHELCEEILKYIK